MLVLDDSVAAGRVVRSEPVSFMPGVAMLFPYVPGISKDQSVTSHAEQHKLYPDRIRLQDTFQEM